MKRLSLLLTAATVGLLAWAPEASATCSEVDIAVVQDALAARFKNTQVASLKCAPVAGLFEVIAGSNVVYVNKDASMMVVGTIFDTTTPSFTKLTPEVGNKTAAAPGSGSTAPAAPAQTRVDWASMPAGSAVSWGTGGKYKVAIFTDLNCPYCQRLHQALKDMGDVEVHDYVGAILSQQSHEKATSVRCARDPAAALHLAYAGSDKLERADCAERQKIVAVNAFMDKMGWRGTPVVVRDDGEVQVGFRSPETLRAFLERK